MKLIAGEAIAGETIAGKAIEDYIEDIEGEAIEIEIDI